MKKAVQIFFCLYLAEMLMLTYARNYFGEMVSPIILLIIGLSMGILPILMKMPATVNVPSLPRSTRWQSLGFWGLVLVGYIGTFVIANTIFHQNPVEKLPSDILMYMQHIVNQFLQGEYPYAIFYDFGYQAAPTYLPAFWFPFCIAQLTKMDYRVLALFGLFLCMLVFFYRVFHSNAAFHHKIVIVVLTFCGLYAVSKSEYLTIAVPVETLIMGYYLLLGTSLIGKSHPVLRGLAVVLCLLSRFSFLFWLPLYAFSVWRLERKKIFLTIGATVVLGLLFGYILPFWVKDTAIFANAMRAYKVACLGEWQVPYTSHLQNGLGLAIYFQRLSGNDVAHKIALLQYTTYVMCLLATCLLSVFLLSKNKENVSKLFNIASLKICLTVFYALVQVPYAYLYVVPLGVSMVLLFGVLSEAAVHQEHH